jgi:hypothetical protein
MRVDQLDFLQKIELTICAVQTLSFLRSVLDACQLENHGMLPLLLAQSTSDIAMTSTSAGCRGHSLQVFLPARLGIRNTAKLHFRLKLMLMSIRISAFTHSDYELSGCQRVKFKDCRKQQADKIAA